MGEFPSGQRGQTVNLLSTTSVVRIHSPPPKSEKPHDCAVSLLFLEVDGLALRRFSTVLPCFCAVCVLHIFLNIVDVFSSSCLAWCGTDLDVVALDPHRDPHAEMVRNNRRVPGAFLTHTVVSPVGSVGSQLVCHWQTLTPHAEINGNGWIPPGRKFQPFFVLDPHSHDLVHEISHLFCGLLLLLAGGVGVGSQRESGIVVA